MPATLHAGGDPDFESVRDSVAPLPPGAVAVIVGSLRATTVAAAFVVSVSPAAAVIVSDDPST
jgi:hypothetical protein